MTLGGWICMVSAVSVVSFGFGWCCWKILKAPTEGKGQPAGDIISIVDAGEIKRRRRRERRKQRKLEEHAKRLKNGN